MPAAISTTSTVKVPTPSSQMDSVQRSFWTNLVTNVLEAPLSGPSLPIATWQ